VNPVVNIPMTNPAERVRPRSGTVVADGSNSVMYFPRRVTSVMKPNPPAKRVR
jgi:hypothetical protein